MDPTPSDDTQQAPSSADAAAADAFEARESAPASESSGDPAATLQSEMERWRDLAYRSQAELDNFRKRVAREQQETRAYANADLLRSLIPIMDNFAMGLDAARAESEKSIVFMGMTMVHKQIEDFLRDMGVQEIEAQGKAFDPNLHEAMSQEPSADVAEGTILRVMRRGYKLKDRLLRAACVVVSSGPPASEPAAE
jgi:molecular chaperone GrpE